MNKMFLFSFLTLGLISCSHLSSGNRTLASAGNEIGNRDMITTSEAMAINKYGEPIMQKADNSNANGFVFTKLNFALAKSKFIPYAKGDLIRGELSFLGDKIIIALDHQIGENPENKNGRNAICADEEKSSTAYSLFLKKSGLDRARSADDFMPFVREELARACQDVGGQIIGEIQDDFKLTHNRWRSSGNSFIGSLVPAKRECYFYQASLKCDVTHLKDSFLTLVRDDLQSAKERSFCLQEKSGCFYANWQEYIEKLSTLEKTLSGK